MAGRMICVMTRSGEVIRVAEEEARRIVAAGEGNYASKEAWKQQGRKRR